MRTAPDLFGSASALRGSEGLEWSGLPIIFDEVFTGLYRLGRFSAAGFLGVEPDISVHAKLLTGGLVPLCATLSSESIFRAFESEDKTDALLHGHSYTAHPVGCQVATESLRQMQAMEENGTWDWGKSAGWVSEASSEQTGKRVPELWSIWSRYFVDWLSHHSALEGAWALGSVLAIHLRAPDGAGYTSTVAVKLRDALRENRGQDNIGPWNIHSRVLGNVLYIMGGQTTTEKTVRDIEEAIQATLGRE